MKIANNTKINHIMIIFTDHCYVISIDILPLKIQNWERLRYFNDFLLWKPDFSSATNDLLPLLKTKNSYSSTSDW